MQADGDVHGFTTLKVVKSAQEPRRLKSVSEVTTDRHRSGNLLHLLRSPLGTKRKCSSAVDYDRYQINCKLVISHTQCDAVTHQAHSTIQVVAALPIVDAIAVADIEAVLGAVPPDCVLDEPGKGLRKRWIELPGIDPLSHGLNNVSTAAGPVAGRTIQVVRVEPLQDAGAMQKVMNQRVDGNHAAADLGPEDHLFGSAEQKGGQGHGEDLVRHTVDFPHRIDQSRRHCRQPVRASRTVGGRQLGVDPADQIAVGKVADEQKQAVGGLVQVAVPQVMARQGTAVNVLGLATGPAALFVPAAMEMPVALELGATDTVAELLVNVAPGRPAMSLHVIVGDRIGRKSTLIATLMLMGIATFLVSLVPTYESIGIWGAVILTVLRFVQGIGVGGEWGGSVLMSMEWARGDKHRGFIASWPQFGVPCGLFLANLAVLAFSQMSGEQFLAWGWRVPFFLSLILVAVGLYIRLGILETPIFRKLVAEQKIERTPMLTVIKQQPKEILLSALVRMAEQAPFYIFTAFVFSYGIGTLNVSRDFLLFAVLTASVVSFVSIPLFGHISDRIGRKKMYMLGAATVGVFGFIYFGMLNTGSLVLIFLAIVLSLIPHDMMYGPQAALIAELFTGRLRYSGASLGYQLASVIAGGPAPLIATWLFAQYGSAYAVAFYILVCAVLTLVATSMMTDYTGKDIEGEYE